MNSTLIKESHNRVFDQTVDTLYLVVFLKCHRPATRNLEVAVWNAVGKVLNRRSPDNNVWRIRAAVSEVIPGESHEAYHGISN